MKKILDSKALYMILSVIVAISLWFYVASLDGNEDEQTISNITVEFVGLEDLEARGLMIVGETPKVSIRVRALPRVLAELDNKTVVVTVDVSRITVASEQVMGYTVTYPESVADSVQEVSRSPANVTFVVAKYTEKEIPIKGVFEGTVANGYVAGSDEDFYFSPSTITVSGQADLVNQVSYALVTVTETELSETITGDYSYQLMSNSDEGLENLNVECSEETVYTIFPVLATAEVPLTLKFTAGGGATEADVSYDILPSDSIIVSGEKTDIDGINEILLSTINLATVRDGDELTLPIPLADELNNISGITEVTVVIHLNDLDTKTVETSDISAIHVPEGWNADVITQALAVEVRGTSSALEDITGDNVRVVADLSGINEAAGQYTLTAKVYLFNVGDDAGILGTDYRVVVSLSK